MKDRVSKMHNPPHPGEVLRDGLFAGTGETVTSFARRLGVSRVALSRVLNGQAALSAEMALRLAAALGGTAESWLNLQVSYDIWQARRSIGRQIERIYPVGSELVAIKSMKAARGSLKGIDTSVPREPDRK